MIPAIGKGVNNPSQTFNSELNPAAIQSHSTHFGQKVVTSVLQGLVECAVAIRTRDLVADLLDFNSIEQFIGKKEPCDIRALIEQSIENNQAEAARKQIVFQTGISEGLWAKADSSALSQVLDNLISNALKYSPSNSTVQIHAMPEQDHVVINIRDQGVGMNEAGQQKLFQKIARLMMLPQSGRLSDGIGVAIVKKCSQALSGSIRWRSSLGSGSTFTIKLPVSSVPNGSFKLSDIKLLAHTFVDLPESSRTFYTRN
jgi:signal transduction histidine kinase